jgi:uncharacterized protein (TIGR02594 family)
MKKLLLLVFLLCSCVAFFEDEENETIKLAASMIGMNERYDRQYLKEFMGGVDPVRTDWCAAFVNSVLNETGIPGSESVSSHPLLARSFLHWGNSVDRDNLTRGDIIVFPRGSQGWQGHVGFYYDSYIENGIEYWLIIGGNQDNSVSIKPYPARSAIGIRRHEN